MLLIPEALLNLKLNSALNHHSLTLKVNTTTSQVHFLGLRFRQVSKLAAVASLFNTLCYVQRGHPQPPATQARGWAIDYTSIA